MLGDAAGLTLDDIGAAQRIEQRGLAVIDMAHDGDNRRPRHQMIIDIGRADHADFDIRFGHADDVVAEFGQHQLGGILIDLVDGG